MPFLSVTRLRLRSARFFPLFAWDTWRSLRQLRRARGYQDGSLLPDRHLTFWTMTAWDSAEAMRTYITAGAHKAAMPKLMHWCDEASVVHWTQADAALPSWTEADRRMRTEGRPSKVLHPTAQHHALAFQEPRLGRQAPLRPMQR